MVSNATNLRTGLVTSLLTIALATGVGAYGTFAYFSDAEQSTQNLFSAGTLDLTLENADGSVDAFIGSDNFAPGDTVAGDLVLKNNGSISSYDGDGHQVSLDVGASLSQTDADGGSTDMASYLKLTTLSYDGQDQLANVTDANGNGYKDAADLAQASLSGLADPGSAGKVFELGVKFHPDAGNDLQGDEVTVDFSFTLQQG